MNIQHTKNIAPNNCDWAFEASRLVKTFGDNRAVDGVNLNLKTGTIYGVLGPKGAGKTTTIRNNIGTKKRQTTRFVHLKRTELH